MAKEELIPTLRSNEYFGQYGRISKILISKRNTASKLVMGTSETALGVYVTYHRKEDAAKAIVAIDGSSKKRRKKKVAGLSCLPQAVIWVLIITTNALVAR